MARIASYGARVVQTGATYAEALAASRERQAETGALEVHAYDHPDVLAGQGTVGREFEQDAPDLTHVLVATGGGGLIGGIAAWYAGSAQVVSVEPEGCPALHDALRAGQPVEAPVGGLAADSLGARQVGELMFPIAQALRRRRGAGARRCDRRGAATDLGPAAPDRRAGRRDGARCAAVRGVHAAARVRGSACSCAAPTPIPRRSPNHEPESLPARHGCARRRDADAEPAGGRQRLRRRSAARH